MKHFILRSLNEEGATVLLLNYFIMIFFTQLIYVRENMQEMFNQFENIALPVIKRYHGEVILRMQPSSKNTIESSVELPYEVQVISFSTEKNFTDYMNDSERKDSLHLKEQSVKSSILIKGVQL